VCAGGVCQPPTCTDDAENGTETDVDCGGATCDAAGHACATGQRCLVAADCLGHICGADNRCPPPGCSDGVENGGETGVDCGNHALTGCGACPAGQGCAVDGDCQSLHCATGSCAPATCNDHILNEGESDVDCGSVCGLKLCAAGRTCFVPADCLSGVCNNHSCQ
jgi:hypothetical protein